MAAGASLSIAPLYGLYLAGCGANSGSQTDAASPATDASTADVSADTASYDAMFGEPDANPDSLDTPTSTDAGPPDGTVSCTALGTAFSPVVWCDPKTQYCRAFGLAPPGSVQCAPLPSSCLGDPTCGCLVDAGEVLCGCVIEDSGIPYSGCFCP
jgi:hypothetical protein